MKMTETLTINVTSDTSSYVIDTLTASMRIVKAQIDALEQQLTSLEESRDREVAKAKALEAERERHGGNE